MRHRAITLAALAAAAFPATAIAAPPWTAPVTVPGAIAPSATTYTAGGQGVMLATNARDSTTGASQLDLLGADGTLTAAVPLSFAASALASYGSGRIAVAGRTLSSSGQYAGTIDDTSTIVTRLGTPGNLGARRTVAGTKGQQLYALASNASGLMAIATGGLRSRSVYIRKPGTSTFSRKLTIRVSSLARNATVAVGKIGDVLFVYEDEHAIRARHIGPRGTVGAVHRLGAGVQSVLQAIVNDNGRLSVAWKSQRVSEGESNTPALVWFTTSAPGRSFGAARWIAIVGRPGAGRYVGAPAIRLLAIGNDALLANTGFDGASYTVEARQVANGHLGAAQRLSPAGIDAALSDAAVTASGAQVVAWRTGIAGADSSGTPGDTPPPHTPVLASVRPTTATGFGAPELVTAPDADVFDTPLAALDPVSGRALVAWRIAATADTLVSVRPAP